MRKAFIMALPILLLLSLLVSLGVAAVSSQSTEAVPAAFLPYIVQEAAVTPTIRPTPPDPAALWS